MVKIKIKNLIGGLFFLTVILYSGSVLQTIYPSIVYLLYGVTIYSLGMGAFKIFNGGKIEANLRLGAAFIFMFMLFQTYMMHNKYDYSLYLIYFSLIVTAFYISSRYDLRQAANVFVKFMLLMTGISLIGHFLTNYTSLLSNLPEVKNINGVVYKTGILFNYLEVEPERNCSIFWEPGLFVTNITWAMLADIIVLKNCKSLHFIIFTLGFFTAKSSAGYVLWFLLVVLMVVYNKKKGTSKSRLGNICRSVFSTAVLILAILFALHFDDVLAQTGLGDSQYFYKLSSSEVADSTRLAAIEYNIDHFLDSPIWGQGFDLAYTTSKLWCDTSTSTFFLNVFGWMGGIYTVLWIIAIFRIKNLNFNSRIVLFFIVISILNKEPHGKIAITWIILYFLLKQKTVPNERTETKYD